MAKQSTLKIYIQIHQGTSDKKKDTVQHTAMTVKEAIEFIEKHT